VALFRKSGTGDHVMRSQRVGHSYPITMGVARPRAFLCLEHVATISGQALGARLTIESGTHSNDVMTLFYRIIQY
jgi:hypothetical protein